jgi:hypothetical protein
MNNSNCKNRREAIAAFILGELETLAADEIKQHIDTCQNCRSFYQAMAKEEEMIRSAFKAIDDRSKAIGDNLIVEYDKVSRVRDISAEQAESQAKQLAFTKPNVWRIIMKNRITKLAAAAVIIVAAVLSINVWDKTIPSAYAFEQTVEAYHTVRYIHIKDFKSGEDEPKEFWLEFDVQGQVSSVRAYMPEWDSPSDGAKIVIWQEGKAKIWFKKKNTLLTVGDERLAQQMLGLVYQVDPRLAVERLYEREEWGAVKIDVEEPSSKNEPIVVTATILPEGSSPGKRLVLLVDQSTKLVTAMEVYQLKGNEYQQVGLMEFHDYNQAIEPGMFTLDDEIPADIIRVDQTTQEVGLVQGDLSNAEIAVEVARQFLEALITNDYDKAGKLFGGAPADWVKQQPFGKTKILRIISIGSVSPHPNPKTGGVIVPCVVEIEEDGKVSEWKLDQFGIRPIYNQPGRWQVFSVPER